jgi:preprotein translocase subunit YajC
MIAMFAVIFGLMYVMFIRPQSKRRKEADLLQRQLGAGDQIITVGGLYGTVVAVDDDSVTLQISPEGTPVNARYSRQAIARVLKQTTVPGSHDEIDADADTDQPVDKAPDKAIDNN